MILRLRTGLALLLATALGGLAATAAAEPRAPFQFGVIGHAFKGKPDEALLRRALKATDQANLAFVVSNGIKAASELCSDNLYERRRNLLNESTRPLIVSLAASDWSGCRNSLGRSNAIERLNRLRELFFADGLSLGERPLALARLSSSAKFRSYAENAHWEVGGILFATINLPADNNHFRPEAGRNSEFEDRLVANRAWLQRLFAMAQRKKLDGLVLFSDGDAEVLSEESRSLLSVLNNKNDGKQDGYAEVRHQVKALAKKFPGQVLLLDAQRGKVEPQAEIAWKGNLGHASISPGWSEIRVNPAAEAGSNGAPRLFDIRAGD